MTFKRKPVTAVSATRKGATPPAPVLEVEPLPDIAWMLDELGRVDRSAFAEWSADGYGDESTDLLAALHRWWDRHVVPKEAERLARQTAIDAAVADLLAAYPGTRVNAAGYNRIAQEDWNDFTAAVIVDVTRTLRRTLKSLPPTASVREALAARTDTLRSAKLHLEASRDNYRRAVAAGEAAAAKLAAEVGLEVADLHDAHREVFCDSFGAPIDAGTTDSAVQPAWARMVARLRTGAPWARAWIAEAATEWRRRPSLDLPDDEWAAVNEAHYKRHWALLAALKAGQAPPTQEP
jgi:hypothetical protein